MKKALKLVLTVALTMFGNVVLADGDTSANLPGGFAALVQKSKGVVLRVEIDQLGREKMDSATMRVHSGSRDVRSIAEAQIVFENGVSTDGEPQLSKADLSRDSNTHGWWRYRWAGWAPAYYYYNYTPVYYSYGYAYRYAYPTYYTVTATTYYPVGYRYYYWTY